MNNVRHVVSNFSVCEPMDFDQTPNDSETVKCVIFQYAVPDAEIALQLQHAAFKSLSIDSRVAQCGHCTDWEILLLTHIKLESVAIPAKFVQYLDGFGAAHGAVLEAMIEVGDTDDTGGNSKEAGDTTQLAH